MWMNSFLHNCLFGRSLLTLRLDSFTWDFKDYTAESWTHLLPLFLGDSPQTSPVCNPWSPSNDLHPNSVVLWLFVSFSGLWTQDLNEYTQTWAASPCGLFSMAGNVAVLYVIWHLWLITSPKMEFSKRCLSKLSKTFCKLLFNICPLRVRHCSGIYVCCLCVWKTIHGSGKPKVNEKVF